MKKTEKERDLLRGREDYLQYRKVTPPFVSFLSLSFLHSFLFPRPEARDKKKDDASAKFDTLDVAALHLPRRDRTITAKRAINE